MNEFRQDPVSGRWVVLATNREERPNQFVQRSTADRDESPCSFCAHQMDTPPVVATYGDPWDVCVVPNLYPVFLGPGHVESTVPGTMPAIGMHEVVIESATHVVAPGLLSSRQVTWMLTAYRDRMSHMRDQQLAYVLPIKNFGVQAGASIEHSHSQIFGLPFVPANVQEELAGSARHHDEKDECVFCRLIRDELAASDRIVWKTANFVAWCPFASRFNYELWIAPRTHEARFEWIADQSISELATLLQRAMGSVAAHPSIEAFNYFLHSLPFDTNRDDYYHWHIEIIPRSAKTAGFELGSGVHINTVIPRQAASELRILG